MKIKFEIYNPGEEAAGIRLMSDNITVDIESGDPGGDSGEFELEMKKFLEEWYDGAKVEIITNKPQPGSLIQIEHVCSEDLRRFNLGDAGVLTVPEDNGDWHCYMFEVGKTIISKNSKFKIIE